jgi:phage terminase large subunit-like protein
MATSGVDGALDYCAGVLAGKIPAGRLVRLACQRFSDDLAAAEAGRSPWEFRPAAAEAPMMLAGLLPNIKGPLGGKPLRLMGWQQFIYANVFGFYDKETGSRRFRQAVVFVPRGNGKTTIAAPVVLYLTFCEGEEGAEGYAAAVTRDQARILFETAQNMVRRSPDFRGAYGIKELSKSIFQETTASRFTAVSSDAKALDGLNVHIAVCDEIGSHKTSEVYDVLRTAMGKRRHPLLLSISTATSNTSGIGKQLWDYTVRVLDGKAEDDTLFGLIYTVDDGDDPWSEETWIKCNPGWGQSVQPDAVRGIMKQARNNPAQEAAAMTKHLNVWMGADEALFSMRTWRACADRDLDLDQLEGRSCHLGLDLASKTDIAALSLVFAEEDPETHNLHYRVFARCYLNEAAVMEARNPSYPGWAAEQYLTVTSGNETDFSVIEDDLLDFAKRFRIQSIAFDPWAATQFAQRMIAEGLPMVEFRPNTQNFSPATKELDAAMRAGRLAHDGNPVLEWCIGNVVGHYDARANVYPRKPRPEQKIDAAIATIMAIARCMEARPKRSVYETRGISFV